MMQELRTFTPQPLSRFEEYFDRNDKSFYRAAKAWVKDRRILFPVEENMLDKKYLPLIIAAVSRFDNGILSPRFDTLAPHLARAAGIICWSEGDPGIQEAKVAVVKESLKERVGVDPETILELIGEAKMDHVSKTIMQAQTLGEARFGTKETLPIVIIEDKITNMMKFVGEYIKIAFPDTPFPSFSEDELDNENFEFDKFLGMWTKVIKDYPNNFHRFRFLYVPPEKDGVRETTGASLLRDTRVRKWIAASNDTLKAVNAGKSVFPGHLADLIYKYVPNQFFHIQDEKTPLDKVFTPHSIVVADVDGPLVSQSNVLSSREAALQSAFRKILEDYYRTIFYLGVEEVANYLLHPTTEPGIFYRKYGEGVEGDGEYAIGIGAEFLKRPNDAILWKDRLPGTYNIRVTYRPNLLDHIEFELNQEHYQLALESIGYKFPLGEW